MILDAIMTWLRLASKSIAPNAQSAANPFHYKTTQLTSSSSMPNQQRTLSTTKQHSKHHHHQQQQQQHAAAAGAVAADDDDVNCVVCSGMDSLQNGHWAIDAAADAVADADADVNCVVCSGTGHDDDAVAQHIQYPNAQSAENPFHYKQHSLKSSSSATASSSSSISIIIINSPMPSLQRIHSTTNNTA
jgi:hypothetical protein